MSLSWIKLALLPLALAAPFEERRATYVSELISGRYLVVLKDNAGLQERGLGAIDLRTIFTHYRPSSSYEMGSFRGFAAELSKDQLSTLRGDQRIAYVEPDVRLRLHGGIQRAGSVQRAGRVTRQTHPPNWGLGRISHRFGNHSEYVFDDTAGKGTCAYILDSGVFTNHVDFEGRATRIARFDGDDDEDNVGHGTHIAGIIGSKTYGVAKKTKLLAIKVLNTPNSGSYEAAIQGLDFAVADSKKRKQDCPRGFVLNMSLGGQMSKALNDAVGAAVDSGIFVVVSAGNDAKDCKAQSPASAPNAFTIASSSLDDEVADDSNWGEHVQMFAPGVNITSTGITSADASLTLSGTSMAAPQVAGLAAYYLGLHGPMSPSALGNKLKMLGTKGVVKRLTEKPGTPNTLAFNGAF